MMFHYIVSVKCIYLLIYYSDTLNKKQFHYHHNPLTCCEIFKNAAKMKERWVTKKIRILLVAGVELFLTAVITLKLNIMHIRKTCRLLKSLLELRKSNPSCCHTNLLENYNTPIQKHEFPI